MSFGSRPGSEALTTTSSPDWRTSTGGAHVSRPGSSPQKSRKKRSIVRSTGRCLQTGPNLCIIAIFLTSVLLSPPIGQELLDRNHMTCVYQCQEISMEHYQMLILRPGFE